MFLRCPRSMVTAAWMREVRASPALNLLGSLSVPGSGVELLHELTSPSVVKEGPEGCETALGYDDAVRWGPKGAQRAPTHPVDGQLVQLLDSLSTILSELRCK